jgi:hypothetical protein
LLEHLNYARGGRTAYAGGGADPTGIEKLYRHDEQQSVYYGVGLRNSMRVMPDARQPRR